MNWEGLKTKSLPPLLAIALLSTIISACGGTSKGTSSTSTPSSAAAASSPTKTASASSSIPGYAKVDGDRDNDVGAAYDDTNNNAVLNYGHAASAVDKQAAAALVKRYYAAALQGDGAKACSMIVSSLSKAVVEDYGHGSAGPAYLQGGKTCPAVMELLFEHFHGQLVAELPKLEVRRVRLAGEHGVAILSFGTLPERQIPVSREGAAWKVDAPLDSELP